MNFFDSLSPNDIVRNIKEMIHCPFCASDYQEPNIKILTKFENSYIIHLLCDDCLNSIMASFSYKYSKKNKEKIDVKLGEMIQFIEKGAISDEDIMDFHKALKSFDGNFEKLFYKRKN